MHSVTHAEISHKEVGKVAFGFALAVFGYALAYWGLHHFYGNRYSLWDLLGLNALTQGPNIPPFQYK